MYASLLPLSLTAKGRYTSGNQENTMKLITIRRVCKDEEGWYNPPLGDTSRWCRAYNCQRWARQ